MIFLYFLCGGGGGEKNNEKDGGEIFGGKSGKPTDRQLGEIKILSSLFSAKICRS